jgi:ATP-binding cassette, subfamily B, bacterial PglK
MLLSTVLELVGIGLIPAFVSVLTNPDYLLEMSQLSYIWEAFGVDDFESLLIFGIAALAIVFMIKNLFIIFYRYIEARYIWNRYKLISGNLFREYMKAPYTFHLEKNSSLILRNVTEEGRFLVNNVLSSLLKLSMNIILTIAIISLLFYVDAIITVTIFLLVGGIGGLLIYASRKKLSLYGEQAGNSRAEMIRNVNEGIGGLKDIRVLKREDWFINRFIFQLNRYTNSTSKYSIIVHSNQPIMETFAVLGMLSIVWILNYQGVAVDQMIAIMTLFGAAIIRLLPATREMVRDLNNLNYYGYSVHPIYDDFSDLQNQRNKRNKKREDSGSITKKEHGEEKTGRLRSEIRFENISFRYPNTETDVIKNLDFFIPKGKMIGITGSTGAGKTTLIDLILGLLKPNQGVITFDGIDLETYMENQKNPIGYIPQFIYLSDDTLRRNIAFGIPDEKIDSGRINKAIQLAQLTSVVDQLPDGLNTLIGEQGVRFSGGQRQRIGIARALYHDPDVLIMDEATSSLDTDTESEIIEAVEKLRGDLTILMITHRTSTMKYCDTILQINNGNIRTFKNYQEYISMEKQEKD